MQKIQSSGAARRARLLLLACLAAASTVPLQPAFAGAIKPAVRPDVSAAEKKCLATAVYFEARGEPENGQAAVAKVILNRVETEAYPDTICGVVFQNKQKRNACQFSFACDGRPDVPTEVKAWEKAKSVAEDVLDGRNDVKVLATATHYHADYVSPRWAPKLKRLSKVGRHIFYGA